MEETTMQRGPRAAPEKRKSSSVATAVATFCSRLRQGFGAQRGVLDGTANAAESQTASTMAVPSAALQLDDPDLDRLASAVFERLVHTRESDVVANPQAALFAIAADVARRWPASSTRTGRNYEDSVTAPADPELLGQWVAELEAPCRATLLWHVNEGLTYRQIAERSGTSPDLVLARLRTAYSQLRLSLAMSTVTATTAPGERESAES